MKKKGFTLVELLVVISIISVLATIGLAVYNGVLKNARDVKRVDDLKSLKAALELYYQTNKQYPVTSTWVYSSAAQPWIPGLTSTYLPGLPKDPFKNSGAPWQTDGYIYAYFGAACDPFSAGQFFALVAQLENRMDQRRNEVKNYKWCTGATFSSFIATPAPYVIVITSEHF